MTTYSIREAKARLSEILRDLDHGDEVIITRRARPCGRQGVQMEPTARSGSIAAATRAKGSQRRCGNSMWLRCSHSGGQRGAGERRRRQSGPRRRPATATIPARPGENAHLGGIRLKSGVKSAPYSPKPDSDGHGALFAVKRAQGKPASAPDALP